MRLVVVMIAVIAACAVARADDETNYLRLNDVVWRYLEDIELTCFAGEPLPRSIELSSKTDDAFSSCFARELQTRLPAKGNYVAQPIVLLPLRALLEGHVSSLPCATHAGAIPKRATIDFAHGSVTTEPANEESQLCIAQHLRDAMPAFRQHVGAQIAIALHPHVTTRHAYRVLMDAPRIAWSCVAHEPAGEVRIVVQAHEGDTDFAVTLPGSSAHFETCVHGKLAPLLARVLDERRAPRIDSEIDASLTFTLVRGR